VSDKQALAGIDIGGTTIKFGLVDPRGKIIFKDQKPTVVGRGAEPLLHLISNIAESLLYHAAEEELEVKWLGVGTPGAVEPKTGKIIGPSPNITGWEGTELGGTLKKRINLPVFVDNDVNVMALAEARFGAAMNYRTAVCIAMGTGVGGGIVIDGKVLQGASGGAGEIGHMVIDPNGPSCRCGARGCLEAYCSSAAIISRANQLLKNELTPVFQEVLEGKIENLNIRKLFAAYKQDDLIARQVVTETAEYLGMGLANVVTLLNPEIVVIGGGIADGGGIIDEVSSVIRKRALRPAGEVVRIVKASLGNDAGFIGASLLGDGR
jgi:glucokinase